MKKCSRLLSVIVLVILTSGLLCVTAWAEDDAQEEKLPMDAAVIAIINGQLSDAEKAALKDTGISELAINEQNVSEMPVIRIFGELFCSKIGEPLDILLDAIESSSNKYRFAEYVALGTTPYLIGMSDRDSDITVSVSKEYYATAVPQFIADIQELSAFPSIQAGCKLEGIYCFDAATSHQGTAVYLKTDKGVYVKYYESPTAEARLYTEDEFRVKAAAYYSYLISDENNYINGEAVGGGSMDFLSYTQSHGATISDAAVDDKVQEGTFPMNAEIILTIGLLVVVGVTVFVVIKAKKEKSRMTMVGAST